MTADDGTVRHVTASPWTEEDRLLMLAWRIYSDSLCQGCGQPRDKAWHPDMNGWYEVEAIECQACTALDAERADGTDTRPRSYPHVVDTRDHATRPLPPLRAPNKGD